MKVIPNWRRVLRKAWSARLMIIAAILSGIEIILPMFASELPRGWFAAASFIATMGAFAARFVAQKELHEDQ